MPQYLTPGVYVEEVDRGGKPIEGVATAVAAFVGFTEKGPREATQVTSWTQYRTLFGDFIEGAYLPTSIYGYFLNGGTRAYVMRVSPAVIVPQSSSIRSSLEVTPLLSTANNDPISVNVLAAGTSGRYKLTVQRGDTTETFDDLSSDKKDKANRYVENVLNDSLKGSKLVRVYDSSGNQSTPEARSPKPGSYSFIQTDDGGKAAPALPAATVRINGRSEGNPPAMEIKAAHGVTSTITIEVTDIPGQDELFKLIVKATEGEENFDVSLKKGPQYAETVINATRNGSKLIRVKDLDSESQLSPTERRPNTGQFALPGTTPDAKASAKAGIGISSSDFTGDASARTGVGALEALEEVTMVVLPDLMGLYQRGQIDLKGVQVVQTAMMNHCELMKNRVAVLDAPPDLTPQQVRNWRMNEANYDSKYAALYYPWIEIDNPVEKGKTMFSPPSGHLAGLWARIDSERGVHKAPANEIVRGVIGLERNITNAEQENLNPDGINCIRSFPGRGIRVWGARTLSSDPSWRYLNVRRLFNYIEASINRGTQWVVFEPNDEGLWQRVKRDVTSFLNLVWMSGALFGATPDQAFFVKCDAETNQPDTIEAGMIITEIGIAPVKPAEFVVFRIGQMVAGGE